jgi:hypothetical protein
MARFTARTDLAPIERITFDNFEVLGRDDQGQRECA